MRSRSDATWPPLIRTADRPSAQALLLPDGETLGGPSGVLSHLSARERTIVLEAGRRLVVNRGATLFSQGTPHEGVFLIESGRIRVFYSAPSGREITLAYWYPGHFVGGPDVFGAGPNLWSGVATSSSSVLFLSGTSIRQLVVQIPALAIGIIEGLSFKGRCYSALAQMLGTRSVTERLAHLLLHLSQTYGVEEEDGTLIAAAFTHADLAHMVGATRQWVTISLKRLQENGVLISRRSHIVVLRPDMLETIRGGEGF